MNSLTMAPSCDCEWGDPCDRCWQQREERMAAWAAREAERDWVPPYPTDGRRHRFSEATWTWHRVPDPLDDEQLADDDMADVEDPRASPEARVRAAIRKVPDEDGTVPAHLERRMQRAIARYGERQLRRLQRSRKNIGETGVRHSMQGRTQIRRRPAAHCKSGAPRGPDDDGDGDDPDGGAPALSKAQVMAAEARVKRLGWTKDEVTVAIAQASLLAERWAA